MAIKLRKGNIIVGIRSVRFLKKKLVIKFELKNKPDIKFNLIDVAAIYL